jgi:hypothetical protein
MTYYLLNTDNTKLTCTLMASAIFFNKTTLYSTDTRHVRKPTPSGCGRGSILLTTYVLILEIYQTNGFAPLILSYNRYRDIMQLYGYWDKCYVTYTITTIWQWRIIWTFSNERVGKNILARTDIRHLGNIWKYWLLMRRDTRTCDHLFLLSFTATHGTTGSTLTNHPFVIHMCQYKYHPWIVSYKKAIVIIKWKARLRTEQI